MSRQIPAAVVLGAGRVALGILWLNEAVVKLHAGFGAADIALVVNAAAHNSRIPEAFTLIADTDRRVSEAFGTYGRQDYGNGEVYMTNARKTFLIDEEGRVKKIFDKVDVVGHAGEVLAAF